MSRWCGEHGRRCPKGCQSEQHTEGPAVPGCPPRHAHQSTRVATNTGFQINDSRGFDIHLTVPVLKGKASLGRSLSTKFRMDETILPKQRLSLCTHLGAAPLPGMWGPKKLWQGLLGPN